MPAGVPAGRFRTVEVSEGNWVADNVFAAGDCVSGAKTVVEGVASGRHAAMQAVTMLTGKVFPAEPTIFVSRGNWQDLSREDLVFIRDNVSEAERHELPMIPLEERKTTFKETTITMSPETVMAEGERCIECSCSDKHDCKLREYGECYKCDPEAIRGGKQELVYDTRHPLIIQDRGKCIKCGTCVKVCKEVINLNLLSIKKRGFFTTVGTAFDKGFPDSCKDCLACVNECPVGALDIKK
jgi:formate dehydrogenase major subunit